MADKLPLKIMLFVWTSALLIIAVSTIGAILLVVAILAGLCAAWYIILGLGLSVAHVTPDNNINALRVFFSVALAFFAAYCIRRFGEDSALTLRIEHDDEEFVEEDEEEEEKGGKGKGKGYGL